MLLGDPDRSIVYSGREFDLYGAWAIRKILNKRRPAVESAERNGYIPKPMFRSGPRKYYSVYEIEALADLVRRRGTPKFGRIGSDEWAEELRSVWGNVRQAIESGEEPSLPLHIRFSNREELRGVLASALRPIGVESIQFVDQLTERMLSFRTW